MFRVGVVSALLGLGAVAAPAHAQTAVYPTKPIRMLVGFPVGGGADVAACVLGPRMSESLAARELKSSETESASPNWIMGMLLLTGDAAIGGTRFMVLGARYGN